MIFTRLSDSKIRSIFSELGVNIDWISRYDNGIQKIGTKYESSIYFYETFETNITDVQEGPMYSIGKLYNKITNEITFIRFYGYVDSWNDDKWQGWEQVQPKIIQTTEWNPV